MLQKQSQNYLHLNLNQLKIQDIKHNYIPNTCRESRAYKLTQRKKTDNDNLETCRHTLSELHSFSLSKKSNLLQEQKQQMLQKIIEKYKHQQKEQNIKIGQLIMTRKLVNQTLKGLTSLNQNQKECHSQDVKLFKPNENQKIITPPHLLGTIYDAHKYQNFYSKMHKYQVKLNHQVQYAMLQYRKQLESTGVRVPNFLKGFQQVL